MATLESAFRNAMSIVPNGTRSLTTPENSCATCLEPFSTCGDGTYYPVDGKRYCSYDFDALFAPRCYDCHEVITGKSIVAGDRKYHPKCFNCQACGISLLGIKYIKHKGLITCMNCHKKRLHNPNSKDRELCGKCQRPIKGNNFLMWKGKKCCPSHFNCNQCGIILTHEAKTHEGKLFCSLCYAKVKLKYCFACKLPIEGRAISALGKSWHPEHFVCSVCEVPLGNVKWYEHKGQAYCETHYHRLIGKVCFKTYDSMLQGEINAIGNLWGKENFDCFGCGINLSSGKIKFIELDGRPFCSKCTGVLDKNTKASVNRCTEDRALMDKKAKKVLKESKAAN